MNNIKLVTHSDVIARLYSDIEAIFSSVGAITPPGKELYESSSWRYCTTIGRKHKGKIGYICSYLYSRQMPRVRIVIHNFAQGGQSITFDSAAFAKTLYSKHPYTSTHRPNVNVKRPTQADLLARKKKEKMEIKHKHRQFLVYLNDWRNGNPFVCDHRYVVAKGMNETQSLRFVDHYHIGFPLVDIEGEVRGLQTIDNYGHKLIYGKKKRCFAPIGNVEEATRIYFCESYATANAIYNLVLKTQKRHVPFCVIAAIDAKNMEEVVKIFKERFKNKKLTICPDNNYLKIEEQKNNVGLLSGYNAAISSYSEMKIIPEATFEGSNWSDAWLDDEQKAIECFGDKKKGNRYHYACERLLCFGDENNSVSLKKACVYALHVGATMYPSKLSEKNLLEKVIANTEHTGVTSKTVRWWWYKIKKRIFAQAQRAKSIASVQDEQISVITVSSMQEVHTQVQALKKKYNQAIFINNAPMGVGKTKDFIQPEFMASNIKGDIPVVITPTKALTKGVSERFGASHYIDDINNEFATKGSLVKKSETSLVPDSLAITINSIIAPKFNDFLNFSKSVFIDEYTQVLRSITSGTVKANLKHRTELKLATLIAQSDYTYIADADFNQIAIDQLTSIVADRPFFIFMMDKNKEASQKEEIGQVNDKMIPTEYQYYRDIDGNFTNKYILSAIEQSVMNRKNVYVASDSKTQLETIMAVLAPHKINILMVNSDNANFPNQRFFLDNPNQYLAEKKPQVVLISPCVQSGVSIEVDYFDHCFGSYSGTVSPVIFAQMLHRVRAQKVFKLALPSKIGGLTVKDSENATALLMGAYTEHITKFGGISKVEYDPETKTHTIGQVSISSHGGKITIEGDDDYARYETLSAQLRALDTQQSNHAANFLLIQAIARGIQITPIDLDLKSSEKDLIKTKHKIAKELTKQVNVTKVLMAKTIDQKDYQKKMFSGTTTCEKDFFEVVRFDIAKALNKKSGNLKETDIEFYRDEGCTHITNFHALQQGIDKARENDTNDKNIGVAKTNAKWHDNKVMLLSVIFNVLNLNIYLGNGSYRQKEAKKARDAIKDNQALVRYITFKLHLNVDNNLSDTAFINKIIKRLLGVRINNVQIRDDDVRYRVYSINELDMMKLRKYHLLRFSNIGENTDICHSKSV